jgi:histidine triad (HIT) family protein
MDDLFLSIIAGEIPSARIYEDDCVVAFLDINPNNKGHALVVPRIKFRNVFDGEPDMLAHMMVVGQKVAKALREALQADGANLLMNNEHAAGQEVFHAHLHVIPRFVNDDAFGAFAHRTYEPGEINAFAEKIKNAM